MQGRAPLSRKRPKTARRRLQFERLEERFVLNGQAILGNDAFSVHENGPKLSLNVLANDVFDAQYTGNRLITSVSFGSEGGRLSIAPDRQSLLYTPPADFSGIETFVYAVDGENTAQVNVTIDAPLHSDDFTVTPNGQTRQLDVLANDPFWSGYTGPRKITAVSVGSAGGKVTISADRKSILYTAPKDLTSDEVFTYVVDNLYPARITIHSPTTLVADSFDVVKHTPPTALHVLDNDPFWAGYSGPKQITQVTKSRYGATIEIAADGKSLIYTQPAEYVNNEYYTLYDSFEYVVDGVSHTNVQIVLHRPVKDDSFEIDQDSSGQSLNVTLNDRYGGWRDDEFDVIDRVTSVNPSAHGGTVAISADGQSVIYTPAVGFTGTDTFTYVADGVHIAWVNVKVTRPVRDDNFVTRVYQDTPNNSLDVLANDFLGNGYSGPKLITSVGPTQHGGTVTIRGDGKALLYAPAAGYSGDDQFTYTVDGTLQASVSLNVAPLAQPDYLNVYPEPNLRPYTIDVLSNDLFSRGYLGMGVITSAEIVDGAGTISVDNGHRLIFNPGSAGSHTIRYTVDGQYEATVLVSIYNVAYADQFVVDQNSSAQEFEVLTNDFTINYPPYTYQGPRIITGVTQSQHGGLVTIAADGRSVHYQPPVDFFGTDSFTYTVDDFMTATVSVEVIRRVRDDVFRVDAADGTQSLPVLVNDLFGANYSGPGQITAVTSTSAGGVATVASDGHSIVYRPRAGFVGTDKFTYTVDGRLKAEVSVVVDAPPSDHLPTFGSLANYTQFLIDDALSRYQYLFGQTAWNFQLNTAGMVLYGTSDDGSHSETNVQVAGVDEGDIVEFDSDYAYMLTDSDVVIVDAWPADHLSVASRIDIEGLPIAEFLHGDRLTVISRVGTSNFVGGYGTNDFWLGGEPSDGSTIVTVIDVSDRSAPTIVQKTTMEGIYVESRAVGDFVYVLVNNTNAVAPRPEIIDADNDPNTPGRYETREEYLARVTANPSALVEAALPSYTSYGPDGKMARTGLLNTPEDVYQPLVPSARNLISVVSFNVESDDPGIADTSAVYTTGAGTIYASLDNFYVFDADASHEDGAVTRIMKFDWEPTTGGVDFAATTTVPGTIINQFSADESGSYLRIATTVSNNYSGNWSGRSEHMLFVLQEDNGVLESVGGLQNLALNESMRSIRFLGDRAFVTTFRNVDPLFAIDLSDPTRPESIGHITLPGFTSYMQLIDQNHLLTIGQNTSGVSYGPTQVSLFDITDLTQPLRIAEYTFERFTTSEAQVDHHAFGYYAEHGLLAMPVARTHVERVDLDGDGYRETSRTVREDLLAVFNVDVNAADPSARLVLSGEIAHSTPVRRSGYIGDKLYSIAGDSVKVVDVSAPNTVLDELTIATPAEPPVVPLTETYILHDIREFVVAPPTIEPSDPTPRDLFERAIQQAQEDLANRLQLASGNALLVVAEAAPEGPNGGYSIVLQVGDRDFLYRVGTSDRVQLVDDDYHFSDGAGTWHAVEIEFGGSPERISGDYNSDGQVDEQDRAVWEDTNGSWSLTEFLAADGNRDGVVDAADELAWRLGFENYLAGKSVPVVEIPSETLPAPDPTPFGDPAAAVPAVSENKGLASSEIPETDQRPKSNDRPIKTATSLLPFAFADDGHFRTQRPSNSRFRFDDFADRQPRSRTDLDSRVDYRPMQSTEIESAIGSIHDDEPASCTAVDEVFDALTRPTMLRKHGGRLANKAAMLAIL